MKSTEYILWFKSRSDTDRRRDYFSPIDREISRWLLFNKMRTLQNYISINIHYSILLLENILFKLFIHM